MINTSMAYKRAIKKNRIFGIFDEIIFQNGERKQLSINDFTSYSINEAASESNKFKVGAAVIKKYSAVLNNQEGCFDQYDFEGASIVSRVGLRLSDGKWEVLDKGTYRIVSAKAAELTIQITAYDEMLYFDKPYSESKLSYPATIEQIIQDACVCCHMTYDPSTADMKNFVIAKRPEGKSVTFRDVISYCAQIMGCFAKINCFDTLCFGWYDFKALGRNIDGGAFDGEKPHGTCDNLDGGNFTDFSSGDVVDGGTYEDMNALHHIHVLGEASVNTDDVRITGIKVVAEETKEEYLYGEEGYVLEITNPFIQSDIRKIAEHVGKKIVGNLFRPIKIKCLSDPCIEAGDAAYVTDRKQNIYQTVITNTTFTMGGYQSVECSAETKAEKEFVRFGTASRLLDQAAGNTEKKLTSYDIAVQQMNQLAMNAMGFYQTVEEEIDGSRITYMHDKPNLIESQVIFKQGIDGFFISRDGGRSYTTGWDASGNVVLNVLSAIGIVCDWIRGGTLTLGGDNNVNGFLSVLNDKGEETGRWDCNGITLPDNVVIQWDQINGANSAVTKITKDTVTTSYVDALNIKAGSVDAEDITGSTIKGKTISGGSISIGSSFSVDEDGNAVANSFKSDNAEITGGTINISTSSDSSLITFRYGGNVVSISGTSVRVTGSGVSSSITCNNITSGGSINVHSGCILYTDNINATNISGVIDINNSTEFHKNTTFAISNTHTFKGTLNAEGAVNLNGITKVGKTGGLISFFGGSASSKKTVTNIMTTSSATAESVAKKLNDLLTALRSYGLIG